jgi:hypothetical protein
MFMTHLHTQFHTLHFIGSIAIAIKPKAENLGLAAAIVFLYVSLSLSHTHARTHARTHTHTQNLTMAAYFSHIFHGPIFSVATTSPVQESAMVVLPIA